MFSVLVRAGARLGAAGLFLFGANSVLQTATAEGDTRTISFHHLHTDENITITYKHNGRYDDDALKKLDWFMRDWRREESTQMDPHLFDLLWETNREVGGTEPIQVVCGFRSPATNAMLRARSSGVAQFSQHTQGHAMDFFMPGVPLEKIRSIGLHLQRGGVGFYPTSGSPFVHLDTGSIRHWPRMTHEELAKVFPDGRTVHIPSDGQPLPGYALALADVERRGGVPSGTSLEAARNAGVITASIEREAAKSSEAKSAETKSAEGLPKRGLIARIFGTPKDEDEQSEQPAPKSVNLRARTPTVVASLTPPKNVAVERIVPMPTSRPSPLAVAALPMPTSRPSLVAVAALPMPTSRPSPVAVAALMPMPLSKPKPAEQTITTASVPVNVFDNRGYWRDAVESAPLPPPAQSSYELASADPDTAGSAARSALAYAAEAEMPAQVPQLAQVRPMGSSMPRLPATATVMPAPANATIVIKPPLAPAKSANLASGGQPPNSPWLRAAILTPSVTGFMTAIRLGPADARPLHELMLKPSQSLVMTFSADPYLGMVADHFSGSAVVFLATATFTTQTSASLR
jgi:uncharacterized protein YcbK (DUF882 family)